MVAPTLPTEKPPIWANFPDYAIGPDINTPTKVDSASVAGNGHVAGADFPTTGQEQNHWQHHTSTNVAFLHDSIAAQGSSGADDDRRVLITSTIGSIDPTGLVALGYSASPFATIEGFAAPSGVPTCKLEQGIGGAEGLEIYPQNSQSEGYMIKLDGQGASAGGIRMDLDDPKVPAIDISIDIAAFDGDGIVVAAGPGTIANPGGRAIFATGGLDGGVGAGTAIKATGQGGYAIQADQHFDTNRPAIEAITSGPDADAVHGIAFEGVAGKFETAPGAEAGAPLRLVPQFDEPRASLVEPGLMWISHDVGLDQLDLRADLGVATPRRRWFKSTEEQYCKLTAVGSSQSNSNEAAPTVWRENISFPAGNIPTSRITVEFLFTCLIHWDNINTLATGGGPIAQIRFFEGASQVDSVLVHMNTQFTPPGGTVAGDAVLWGQRENDGSTIVSYRFHRKLDVLGANDFKVDFHRFDSKGGSVDIDEASLTIETVD